MSIDLTTLITNLQADIDAVDSSTSMSSILSLMHKARKITGISNYYDSAGLLPGDSSYDGMLAFSKADNTVYKFVDSGLIQEPYKDGIKLIARLVLAALLVL